MDLPVATEQRFLAETPHTQTNKTKKINRNKIMSIGSEIIRHYKL